MYIFSFNRLEKAPYYWGSGVSEMDTRNDSNKTGPELSVGSRRGGGLTQKKIGALPALNRIDHGIIF